MIYTFEIVAKIKLVISISGILLKTPKTGIRTVGRDKPRPVTISWSHPTSGPSSDTKMSSILGMGADAGQGSSSDIFVRDSLDMLSPSQDLLL
jgi:hypothetical protein